ncbi:MAG: acyl-CoA dehydrogenase [Dehalococcoidia bacterium]|jgi:acyl-CoA dehydrogenase|nr:acyl-CoA dehydrogenase [Dehalococcoidia bacterium]MDP6227915.1 acyl-CoA dehydrogenase [Dehalococcoidia bacterium]MDP7084991.1 acyl-CoA dehydrogenase [Dehalococcoidia bacterium]MDP7199669.1 acyl-CoA dehydrogenase [Dehalococcoidia bacterium]MDP7511392.1 acyl-CoA dehydrogenase [Dehalococcoidia bacterium]
MDFALSEAHTMLGRTLRQFVEREVIPLEQVYKGEFKLPDEALRPLEEKVKAAGFWQPMVAVEDGGGGLDKIGIAVVTEETWRSVLARTMTGPKVNEFLYYDSDVIRDKYLYPTIRGEKRPCTAFSEPGTGSDVAGIITNAQKVEGGYLLNGHKIWSGHAPDADYVAVLARMKGTERREGHTLFVVDRDAPGCTLVRAIPAMGHTVFGEWLFQDCFVPDAQRTTPEGGAWGVSQARWTTHRYLYGAQSLGLAGRCQDLALRYVKTRSTFGQPLANRQAIQFMLAESEIGLQAMRALVYQAAWKAEMGLDARHDAAIVKVFATETATQVIDRALQIHGAAGYSTDLPIEVHYRCIRGLRISDGPSEVHRSVIARNILRDV